MGCSHHPAACFGGLNQGDIDPGLLLQPTVPPPQPCLAATEDAVIRKKKTFNTFIQRYKSRFVGHLFFPLKTRRNHYKKPKPSSRLSQLTKRISIHLSRSQCSQDVTPVPTGKGTKVRALGALVPWAPCAVGIKGGAALCPPSLGLGSLVSPLGAQCGRGPDTH